MTVTVTGLEQVRAQEAPPVARHRLTPQSDLHLGKILVIALRVICVATAVLTLVTAIIAEAPALLHYTCMFAVASCVLFTFDNAPNSVQQVAQFAKPRIRAHTPLHTKNFSNIRLLTPSPSLQRQKNSPPLSPVLEANTPRATPALLTKIPSFASWPKLQKQKSIPFLPLSTSYVSLNNYNKWNSLARAVTAPQAGFTTRA